MAGYLERPAPSGLADVIEIILDKGVVIDAYVRVSLLGIELLTIDARIVVASVDTYLRFAEATNRLDLHDKGGKDIVDLFEDTAGNAIESVASKVVEKKVGNVVETVKSPVTKATDKVQEATEKVVDAVTPDED
jgi:gas vesicle structural protein